MTATSRNSQKKWHASQDKALHVVSVTSGKGGVGKTVTTINLAVAAASQHKKVLLLDGDLGLANVDIVLGLSPRYNITDVIDGHVGLRDIIIPGPFGIDIIPSASGIARLTQLSYIQKLQIVAEVGDLNSDYDVLMIDTGAGIADAVMHLNLIADDNVIVTTPEPHAMTDAYAMIKVLSEQRPKSCSRLLVNMALSSGEAEKVYQKIASVCKQFLGITIEYLGYVPLDPQVGKNVAMRRAAHSAHTLSGQAWHRIGEKLFGQSFSAKRDQETVWRELIWTQQQSYGLETIRS